ncbi:hypothetical protein F4815DRAFT_461984 [Daldinia loculata]|nr:hypothetical protein F4815DRAFT_461984 [Daldinia loculata]
MIILGLKEISFPDLEILSQLAIEDATELENVSIPHLTSNFSQLPPHRLEFFDTPKLTTFTFGNISSLHILNLTSSVLDPYMFSSITSIDYLIVEEAHEFENLRYVETLQLIGDYYYPKAFSNITSLQNLTFTNTTDRATYFGDSLLINNSLVIENCYSKRDSRYTMNDLAQISSIGSYLQASNNTAIELNFRQLTDINGDISIYENTDCTLDLTQLSDVATLSLVDNVNTTLPWFPGLRRANNIHIRGYIDTSPGPNIFPALTAVSGNLTIEAWNDDFNCSKLVDQYQNGLIHNLACNGTNNETGRNTESPPGNASTELSQGAWAGIGVGIGVFVIGTVFGMIWLLLRLKRWKKELMEIIRQQEAQQEHRRDSLEMDHEPPNLNLLFESDGTGIIREKPDDHLREAGGRAIIAEHPDDHIRELPVPPAELEGAPDMERRT